MRKLFNIFGSIACLQILAYAVVVHRTPTFEVPVGVDAPIVVHDVSLSTFWIRLLRRIIGCKTSYDVLPCPVSCSWPETARGAIRKRLQVSAIQLLYSMEGEAYYPDLNLSRRDAQHRIASTSFQSDVPLPYFSFAEYQIQSIPPKWKGLERRIATSFVASNCKSKSDREALVQELMASMRVDSFGKCLNNMPNTPSTENGSNRFESKRNLIRRYPTHLAFENQCVDDYITEKFWGTLQAGVIPVYYGAPNIAEHAPNGSFVHVRDFTSRKTLAAHLVQIGTNRTLYDSYHAWRRRPLPGWFVDKYAFTRVHSECRVCLWAASQLQLRGLHK
tara:strand:+ start:8481 stop:9476 length:996 start_codon:yes stop_codon:yes gene_type:complete